MRSSRASNSITLKSRDDKGVRVFRLGGSPFYRFASHAKVKGVGYVKDDESFFYLPRGHFVREVHL